MEPALTETELSLLLKASLDCVVPLPEGGSGSGRSKSQKEESYEDAVEQERLMEHSLSSLQELLLDLLLQDVSSDRLFDIFTVGYADEFDLMLTIMPVFWQFKNLCSKIYLYIFGCSIFILGQYRHTNMRGIGR